MKHIYFTVTNDLTYDQRMHRICTSLASAGYCVTLVGRKLPDSIALKDTAFAQKRITCLFHKGFAFYAEYNLRLFFFLLFRKMDGICAIDLDTILPCLVVSKCKGITRIYDAHEYFTELKEVRTRRVVRRFWSWVEKLCIPRFENGYTVSEGLANEFHHRFGRHYRVIRNLPVLQSLLPVPASESFVVYQGAVNEARGFEYLIPAMKAVPCKLVICGNGNFMAKLVKLIAENEVADRVELKGMMLPEDLRTIARKATLGLGLAEKEGLNQFYALPNKFLEYMHACLPQIAMNFPEYQKINQTYPVAILLDELSVEGVAAVINETLRDKSRLMDMRAAAAKAREIYCWQEEEKKLLQFYQQLFT